jgi:hypothetical protein
LFKKDCKTPKPPVKPSKKISTNCRLPHTLQDYNSLTLFDQDAYRKYREFKEKYLSVNLKNMNVGDNISIFKEKVLIELPKKEDIKVVIKSEKSNAKIEKTVEFEIEENPIEYYDYLKSELDK